MNSILVGNELVNTGQASASQVVAAIGTAKANLRAVGYNGPIATVDTMSKHPLLFSFGIEVLGSAVRSVGNVVGKRSTPRVTFKSYLFISHFMSRMRN